MAVTGCSGELSSNMGGLTEIEAGVFEQYKYSIEKNIYSLDCVDQRLAKCTLNRVGLSGKILQNFF
jgi:hypothetical protein